MAWKYNPFTDALDQTGSGGGTSYIDGEVEYHSNLGVAVGSPAVNSAFLVKKGEGLYFISRKPAGIWVRELNNGNLDDWKYAGTFSDLYRDANFRILNNADVSKELAFDVSGVTTGTTRTLTAPNASGRIALSNYAVVTSAQTLAAGAVVAADTTAGAFTLTLPASPANGDTVSILDYASTFDTNALTIARNGSNIESLAENMDGNIEDAAFSLVYVGSTVGWKVVPYFGSKTNLASAGPIGATIPSTGAFTTLTATTLQNTPVGNTGASTGAFTTLTASTIAGPLGATVGSTSAAAIAVGHANSGIYVNSNQIIFTKQGVECMFFDNSSRVNINTTGGLQIVQTDAPIIFSRAISLFPDATNGALAQRSGTQAQTFRLYSTFSSSTSFERLNIASQTGGSFFIGTEKGASGLARGLELRTDNVARINISATGGIGFFGAAAAAQPTAVADATDAASAITQLNALLARMRTLGLIAT
jgi:hypothetical protein